jgi:uncharacterized protein DUF1707
MNATTENNLPAELRASDSDRDAVVSDLGEHFQAGRLTAEEFDERMGRALAARTWGELRNLLADLPATRLGPQAPAATKSVSAQPSRSPGSFALPPIAALAASGIAVAVLVNAAHDGGFHLAPSRRAVHSAAVDPPRQRTRALWARELKWFPGVDVPRGAGVLTRPARSTRQCLRS